ncbi:MAG TPA: Gfo/Idh/MocA family oxidoreductase [Erysipelothrix sp.]
MRIGTIGSGAIVEDFVSAARLVEGVTIEAVFSRTKQRASEFAEIIGVKKYYDNIEAMFRDESIDFIYIASPNSLHYDYVKTALSYNKHVIVEKPFVLNYDKALELVSISQEKNLMLFEAICNIHMPNYELIKNNIKDLGDIKLVQANYSQYSSRYDAYLNKENPNVFNPLYSGGCLADLNVYNIHFVVGLFGRPQKVNYFANKGYNGIDTSGILILEYDDFMVELTAAKDSFSYNFAQIQGEKGYMMAHGGSNSLEKISIMSKSSQETINLQDKPRLFYQIRTFKEIYDKMNYQQRDYYLEQSLAVVQVLETALNQVDLNYKK